jgi:tRNA U34 2-thiouridine synthase MnmA/TrmU
MGEFSIKENKVFLEYVSTLSVAPGQYAVLYQGNVCLGGGEIEKIID